MGNHKPEGQAVVIRAQRGHYSGPRVYDFPYIPRTQCITCLDHSMHNSKLSVQRNMLAAARERPHRTRRALAYM